MTVLHLIDAASPQARPTTLALLAATAQAQAAQGADVRVLLLGGSALSGDAAAVGLHHAHRLSVPFGRAELGVAGLRHMLRDWPTLARIHAWSAGALRVATWLRPRVPRLVSVVCPPDTAMTRAIRAARRRTAVGTGTVALDPGVAETLRVTGVAVDAVEPAAPVLPAIMQPTEQIATQRQAARQTLREQWRSYEQPAGEFVVALLGDPCEAPEADQGSLAIGLMRESLNAQMDHPPDIGLLVHPAQRKQMLAKQLAAESRVAVRLIQDARLAAPWQVLAGCDAALSLTDRHAGLSLGAALAAGLPVVAPDTPRHRYRLTHQETALLAPTNQARRLAYQLERLVLDPPLAARVGTAGQEVAGDLEPWLAAIAAAAGGASHTRVGTLATTPNLAG